MVRIHPYKFWRVSLPFHQLHAFARKLDLATQFVEQPQGTSRSGQRIMVQCDFQRFDSPSPITAGQYVNCLLFLSGSLSVKVSKFIERLHNTRPMRVTSFAALLWCTCKTLCLRAHRNRKLAITDQSLQLYLDIQNMCAHICNETPRIWECTPPKNLIFAEGR